MRHRDEFADRSSQCIAQIGGTDAAGVLAERSAHDVLLPQDLS